MKIVDIKLDKIIPYSDNPRFNKKAVMKVAQSIKSFGWQQPIVVDSDNIIIVGHTRLLAAKSLKMETAPVLVATDLPEEKIIAYRIADNRVGEHSEWDRQMLIDELLDIKDDINLELAGFYDYELDVLLKEKSESESADQNCVYDIIVEVDSEGEQKEVFDMMSAKGLKCLALSV